MIFCRVAVLAGHDRLGGFFADLLQDGVGALVRTGGRRSSCPGRRWRRVSITWARRWPGCRWKWSSQGPICRSKLGVFQDRVHGFSTRHRPSSRSGKSSCGARCGRRCRVHGRAGSPCSSTTSWSQSRRISCTCCTWPDSSPLCHKPLARAAPIDGARRFSAVSARASRFIQANISTSPLDALLRDDRHQAVVVPA